MIIQVSKKILLSLIFTSSITFAFVFLFSGIMNATDNPDQPLLFLCWVVVGILFLIAVSSICWITNFNKGFWLWKLPALLILPFSIPFLILDYLESKKSTVIVERPIKYKTIIARVIAGLSLFSCLPLILFLIGVKTMINENNFEYWILFPIAYSSFSVLGSVFLLLNIYHPNKMFAILRWFATPLIWFYLFLEVMDQKQSHYFFKHDNISRAIIPENSILQNS